MCWYVCRPTGVIRGQKVLLQQLIFTSALFLDVLLFDLLLNEVEGALNGLVA